MSDDIYKAVQTVVHDMDPNDYVAQLASRELIVHHNIEGQYLQY